MTLIISHPLTRLTGETIGGMIRACASPGACQTSIEPFENFARENTRMDNVAAPMLVFPQMVRYRPRPQHQLPVNPVT